MRLISIEAFRPWWRSEKPQQSKALRITQDRHSDSAEQTLAKMEGGWLVDHAAYPASRGDVEDWMYAALLRGFATLERGATEESRKWFRVSERLLALLRYTRLACRKHERRNTA